jgi:hypothetical protein
MAFGRRDFRHPGRDFRHTREGVAKAGIQGFPMLNALDSRLRGKDEDLIPAFAGKTRT